jgi:hypothetical protein
MDSRHMFKPIIKATRFEVLTAVLTSTLKMDAACYPKTLVTAYKTNRRPNSKDVHLKLFEMPDGYFNKY